MHEMKTRLKVVFFGTPQFAADLLKALIAHRIDLVGVVTKPDRPQGRSEKSMPSEVKQMALKLLPGVPLWQPESSSSEDFFQALSPLKADLFVVVAYGELIKQRMLDLPALGCINVHASLLPKYRGAAPIQRSIIAGETETGITIMQMVRKMDAGDIIKTVKVPIGTETTYGELEAALCLAAEAPLLEVLAEYAKGIRPEHFPQDETKATFAGKIELADCQIDWQRSAKDIHNLIRGVNPHPGAWCYVHIKGARKRLKITKSTCVPALSGEPTMPSGTIFPSAQGQLQVACGHGKLALLELQLEGKRKMGVDEFLRGIAASTLAFE